MDGMSTRCIALVGSVRMTASCDGKVVSRGRASITAATSAVVDKEGLFFQPLQAMLSDGIANAAVAERPDLGTDSP